MVNARRGRRVIAGAVVGGVLVHRKCREAAKAVTGACVWSTADLLPGRPTVRDEPAAAGQEE